MHWVPLSVLGALDALSGRVIKMGGGRTLSALGALCALSVLGALSALRVLGALSALSALSGPVKKMGEGGGVH